MFLTIYYHNVIHKNKLKKEDDSMLFSNIFKSKKKETNTVKRNTKDDYYSFPLVEESESLLSKYNNDIKAFKSIISYEPEEVRDEYYRLSNELLWTIHYLSDNKSMTKKRYELLSDKYKTLNKQIDEIIYASILN